MRITPEQRKTIGETAVAHFGEGVKIFLFGSRTDPEKRGGDIDLLIENVPSENISLKTKIAFLSDLKRQMGDQKIDIVFRTPDKEGSVLLESIDRHKVRI
jgi:predicted nucleotidyltransferase